MNSKQLSEFYNISTQAVNRWDSAKRHRKIIQAEADVTPLEWQLVGEISQLVYTYNAMHWVGVMTTKTAILSVASTSVIVGFYDTHSIVPNKVATAKVSNTAEMKLIKLQLEKLVYGEEK